MRGRLFVLAFLVATVWVHSWGWVPHGPSIFMLALAGGVLLAPFAALGPVAGLVYSLILGLFLGVGYGAVHVWSRLAETIPAADINKVSRIQVEISSLVRLRPDNRQFIAKVVHAMPSGLPSTVLVSWSAQTRKGPYSQPQTHAFPDLVPGQLWSMNVLVKPAHGARNPHGFDYEQHLFGQGIRVLASVRGQPEYLGQRAGFDFSIAAERWRHRVRQSMRHYVSESPYGAVMLALAIGDQASITAQDWALFNRAGLTHLMSISGSHVTLMAVLVAALVSRAWRLFTWRGRLWAEYYPAQQASAWAGLLTATGYCILAGWGVPAQRTFLMLALWFLARLSGRDWGASRVLCAAAWLIVLWDPWAVLSTGFYLSFAAVSVLVFRRYWMGEVLRPPKGKMVYLQVLQLSARLQLRITVALFPVLAYLFHEISLISPFTNAYAIPLVGSVLTPLALLLALVSSYAWLDGVSQLIAALAHWLLHYLMQLTAYLVQMKWAAFNTAAAPLGLMLAGMLGVLLLSLPGGWVPRSTAVGLLLSSLLYSPVRPKPGEWQLTALDVGQGSAVLVRTHRQVLLYDAGLRYSPDSDEGLRTILPYLRSQGIRALDVLVLSHADLDHVGGASSILMGLPVAQSRTGFNLAEFIQREERLLARPPGSIPLPDSQLPCVRGDYWEADGVRFEFVWPLSQAHWHLDPALSNQKNSQSCVLQISGRYHSALLLGDVGIAEEQQMMDLGLDRQDVVLIGHHGSRSSSGASFVTHLGAAIAVSQNGHWSRFSHPHPTVERRWQQSQALFMRTDYHGAVQVYSQDDGLWYSAERERRKRHWQRPIP